LEFARTPTRRSSFRSFKPDFTHPNSSRLQSENILREDEKNLDKIITLQLQF